MSENTVAEDKALDTIKLVPAVKARALGFSDRLFDMFEEKDSVKDFGEYLDEMRELTAALVERGAQAVQGRTGLCVPDDDFIVGRRDQ